MTPLLLRYIHAYQMSTFSRRHMLRTASCGFGALALNALLGESARAASPNLLPKAAPITPRAKRVIFLCMSGGPAQLDTFDYKPQTGKKKHPGSVFNFSQHGESGLWISELHARDRQTRRQTLRHQRHARRHREPRPVLPPTPHRRKTPPTPQHGRLDQLRPRHRKPKPPRLRQPQHRQAVHLLQRSSSRRSTRGHPSASTARTCRTPPSTISAATTFSHRQSDNSSTSSRP